MKDIRMIIAATCPIYCKVPNVSAEFVHVCGANLKMICGSCLNIPSNIADSSCAGYLVVIMSVLEYIDALCLSLKSIQTRAAVVVQEYLSDQMEKLHLDTEELVFDALQEAFTCTD